MQRNDHGALQFEKDSEAARSYFLDYVNQNTVFFHSCDGILEYVTQDGELIRVGLEVKSKQTTSARTSLHSMREPEEKHVKQCVAYSKMYEVDHYVIL